MTPTVWRSMCNTDFLREVRVVAVVLLAAVLAALVLPIQPSALAQTTSATLTGTVFDASGGGVVNAAVSLKNEASGDLRATTSNGEGYFTFAAVPPGTYSVIVEKDGFSTWEAKSVVLNSDDKRSVSGIKLKPGAKNETVVVEAADTQITPTESGEKSTLINQHILQNVAIVAHNPPQFAQIIPAIPITSGAMHLS